MKRQLKTEWGTAKINKNGYYVITSTKEGYGNKRLHRLIYEKHYGKIPEGYVIHHKDHNKLNNNIDNLELLSEFEHKSLHFKNHKYSYNNPHNFNPIIKIKKRLSNRYKQGFIYKTEIYINKGNKKSISSTNLIKMKDKLKDFILSDNNNYCYTGFEYENELRIIKGVD